MKNRSSLYRRYFLKTTALSGFGLARAKTYSASGKDYLYLLERKDIELIKQNFE